MQLKDHQYRQIKPVSRLWSVVNVVSWMSTTFSWRRPAVLLSAHAKIRQLEVTSAPSQLCRPGWEDRSSITEIMQNMSQDLAENFSKLELDDYKHGDCRQTTENAAVHAAQCPAHGRRAVELATDKRGNTHDEWSCERHDSCRAHRLRSRTVKQQIWGPSEGGATGNNGVPTRHQPSDGP